MCTNPNPNCIDHFKLQTGREDGKTYWFAENAGNVRQKLEGECPVKEKWVCTERKPDKKISRGGASEQDQIKEKELKGVIKIGIEDKILSGKNLVLDLVEHVSHEFRISNCWICEDTGMSEIWPWEGRALSPQEIMKLMKINRLRRGPSPIGDQEEMWRLRSRMTGEVCLWRRGMQLASKAGEMSCKRTR